jgi:peptidoglycan/xylan/chitin deacetylase (PgdA/CDA1 family)
MEVYISLFGKRKEVLGWLKLLEQEKIPFRYKGENLNNFSIINILIGFPNKEIKNSLKKEKDKVYIFESNPTPSREKLIEAFNSLNLPYVHLWYYPSNCSSVFLFRVDVDYVDSKGLENIFEITKKFDIKGTYFVNISGEEEFDEEIGHLKLKKPTTPQRKEILQKILRDDNEIANHGYWHYIFKNHKKNYQNIKKCNFFLKKLFEVQNKGFAAPGGKINNSLLKAINQAKLLYSSNELSEGGFPYFPYIQNKKSKVLEIPVYYLCDASFEALEDERNYQAIPSCYRDILRRSYLKYIKQQVKSNEPIGILAHPHLIGRVAKNFFDSIFNEIKKLKIPSYTFERFARWWKRREKIKIKVFYRKDKELIIQANKYPVLVEIIYKGRKNIKKIKKTIINLKN